MSDSFEVRHWQCRHPKIFCVYKMHASILCKLATDLQSIIIYIGNGDNCLYRLFMFIRLTISSASTCTVSYNDQKLSQL
jgi:hypothetical protein